MEDKKIIAWKDQKKLGAAVGISASFINDILNRRRQCPVKRAYAMSRAYYRLFGVQVEPHEFTFNQVSSSPIFKFLTPEQLMQAEEIYYANNKPRTPADCAI